MNAIESILNNQRIAIIDGAMASIDSLIAATALTHQMVLVTMNEDDFENTGLEIVNPW